MQDERTQPIGPWPEDDETAARERTEARDLPAHEVDPSEGGRRPGPDDDEPELDDANPLVVRGPTG